MFQESDEIRRQRREEHLQRVRIEFGVRLVRLREQAGLLQSDLAQPGIATRQYICQLEHAKLGPPGYNVIELIAERLARPGTINRDAVDIGDELSMVADRLPRDIAGILRDNPDEIPRLRALAAGSV